ncbi:MAG TPA: HAD hydrolase-like protein [Spirochaetota bacterium]|mgnify:FL=1|jgi:phosphoglycolate phosphatase-like HAD superfamily hydrolase|nr:MAG: Phosphoglycolate phosphatase [Spirochaetes bacterium ADurb.Bin133]HNZ28135.1 HAD hydrolase-like protein [Spirochaetota bacterium]HPY87465.1 HAD hydrolase-like protein [Spirochaetota bacterium]
MNKFYDLRDYLFLFDIDGTILDTKGDGKRAVLEVIGEVLGINPSYETNFAGGVDLNFFTDFFNLANIDKGKFNEKWEVFKNKYIRLLESFAKKNEWFIYPNVYDSIEYLSKRANIGLATGNLRDAAFIKLKKFNLDIYFNCGGFGDTVLKRGALVANAIKAAESFYNRKFEKNKIILLGDTDKDVLSAQENGIIPALIDYRRKYKDCVSDLGVNYYGRFENISLLFSALKNNNSVFFDFS